MVGFAKDIKETIEKEFRPDTLEFNYNISILSPVGIA
jgi:hypothetical protein